MGVCLRVKEDEGFVLCQECNGEGEYSEDRVPDCPLRAAERVCHLYRCSFVFSRTLL